MTQPPDAGTGSSEIDALIMRVVETARYNHTDANYKALLELRAAIAAVVKERDAYRRDSERCELVAEDDGCFCIDLRDSKDRLISMSFHKDGNINWAGLFDGESEHNCIKDSRMGKFAYRVASAISAGKQGEGDE